MHKIAATGLYFALLSSSISLVQAQEDESKGLLAPQTAAQKALFEKGPACNPKNFVQTVDSYNFDGDLSKNFIDSPRWLSDEATLKQIPGQKAEITANGTHISEAWLAWHETLPSDNNWMLSSKIKVPKAWDKVETAEAQVGIGMFVGTSTPAEPDSKEAYMQQSPTVYEVNLATVAQQVRFIQAQMIKNRLGFDPDQTSFAETDLEELELNILYCSDDQSLSVYYNDQHLDTQAINHIGAVNWNLEKGAALDVGVMGFAENSDLTHNAPTVEQFRILIEK